MVNRQSKSSSGRSNSLREVCCTGLNVGGVMVEEFPRVEIRRTEIVGLGEVNTTNVESFTVAGAATAAAATAAAGEEESECASEVRKHKQDNQSHQNHRKSGRFSLFSWFKKENNSTVDCGYFDENSARYKTANNNHRGELRPKTIYSSSGSVETTCSTATVHSFTFRSGQDILGRRRGRLINFRKHSSADDFAVSGPSCVAQFDSEPFINRDCVYNKKKYEETGDFRPVTSPGVPEAGKYGAVGSSGENISAVKTDPKSKSQDFYRSLPTAGKTADLPNTKKRYSHVRGKRPAPKPPVINKSESSKDEKTNTLRRKRRAPKPPIDKTQELIEPGLETKKCVAEIDGSDNQTSRKSLPIINDTLKLEGGILLPRKSPEVSRSSVVMNNQTIIKTEGSESGVKKSALLSAGNNSPIVVPRPWYKRSNTTLSERDISGSFRREVLKIPTLSKSPRDKTSRFSFYNENQESRVGEGSFNPEDHQSSSNASELNSFDKSLSRLNHLFSRSDGSKAKKEDKRKSNLSILANISELDREAAAIVQREQARNQAVSKSVTPPELEDNSRTPSGDIISEMVSSSIEPQRRGTRALISKFNAISNITKVTVNATTFFTKSAPSQSAAKIDVVRPSDRNDRNLVTKRLVCDGTERINETGPDISSINFFRRLEAAASRIPENNSTPAAPGWEEKIKRYFPDAKASGSPISNEKEKFMRAENAIDRNYFPKHRERGNLDRSFEMHDADRNVGKIEHLSRADLKEMLIEMKHSLPKRPKPKSSGKSLAINSEKIVMNGGKVDEKELVSSVKDGSKLTPIGKSSGDSRLESRSRSNVAKSDLQKKLEIASVSDLSSRTKVSSGVQTSANLRKVEIKTGRERQTRGVYAPRTKSGVKIAEDTICAAAGRNGSNTPGLARNTFQLIRPRDFACIEALKTEKGGTAGIRESQNTYMNVIEDSIYANAVISPGNNSGEDKNAKKNDTGVEGGDKTTPNHIANDFKLQTGNPLGDFRLRDDKLRKIEGEEKAAGVETNMNTIAINRLLRKLEGAIASGQHQQAAGLAKELAQLKIHCSVVRQRSGSDKASDFINVDMYIEDKLAHQGPIPLQLSLNMTVAQLKNKVFAEFDIPANVQRWIIGKNLADNDDFTINELKAVDKSSIFLYLVAPDLQNEESTRVDQPVAKEEAVEAADQPPVDEEPVEIVPVLEDQTETIEIKPPEEPSVEELKLKRYEHLMSLENSDVIPNSVPIECPICFAAYGPCEGVILRDCLHMFCRTCIANTIMYCEEAEVKCPFRDSEYICESTLQEREIKALVTPEIYEQHLAKSVSQAENNAGNNAFHCKTPDCPGWCIYDDNVNVFLCPVCGVNNCLTCQAIHTNKNCREYQDEIRLLKETDQETKRTAAVLEEMVESGEALACPTCAVVLMKKWGCDWLRCSMCKTEICWVTRGPRWGPGGKGDTSGGCKCGENGVKCHPRCNYCH